MQSSASLADLAGDAGAHFSAKEKQSMERLIDHLQFNPRCVPGRADHQGAEGACCRSSAGDLCPKHGISDATFYKWRLRIKLKELASQRRRLGYRRLGLLLARQGIRINHKKLYRLYERAFLRQSNASQTATQFDNVFGSTTQNSG
jgi:hypothetical protein